MKFLELTHPLMIAIAQSPDIDDLKHELKIMDEYKIHPEDIRTEYGDTLLSLAVSKEGREEVVDFLCKILDVNKKNENGEAAIHKAVNNEMIEILIRNGAGVDDKNSEGYTKLHLTCFCEESKEVFNDMVGYLIHIGANVNTVSKNKNTPLHEVASCYNRDTSKLMELLINNGAKIDEENEKKVTPLLKAGIMGSTTAVNILLRNGADPEKTTSHEEWKWSPPDYDGSVRKTMEIVHLAAKNKIESQLRTSILSDSDLPKKERNRL